MIVVVKGFNISKHPQLQEYKEINNDILQGTLKMASDWSERNKVKDFPAGISKV